LKIASLFNAKMTKILMMFRHPLMLTAVVVIQSNKGIRISAGQFMKFTVLAINFFQEFGYFLFQTPCLYNLFYFISLMLYSTSSEGL